RDSGSFVSQVPGPGTLMSVDRAREDYHEGDYLGAALNAVAAGLDVVPGIGHLAAGAIGHLAAGGGSHLAPAAFCPFIKRADKQLVQASDKELLDTWNHPLSNVRFSRRYGDMTATHVPGSQLEEQKHFDFNTVEPGSHFAHPAWDRTATGIDVTGVN